MKFIKKTLSNGLRVLTVPMKDNQTVTVLVLVATGSKYESKKENGLSHFLEHMCFKGTKRRPSAREITRELDGLGAQYNAWTGHEYTGYFVKADAKHLTQVFDIVSDMYLNPIFSKDDIEKEKGVIIEEINMYEDMPQRHVADVFMSAFYGDQPVGRNIAGTKENVLSFTQKDLTSYHNRHYVPKSTVVVISGGCTADRAFRLSEKIFGKFPNNKKDKKSPTKNILSSPKIAHVFRKTDQTHFILGFPSYSYKNKKLVASKVLSSILGGGMSSRLFTLLREELGVAYYVYASADAFIDHGHFEIGAGVSNSRLPEVLKKIFEVCLDLKKNLVEKEELDRVKEFLVGNLKLSLESSDAFASFFGNQEITDRELKNISDIEKEIRKVSAKDILYCARDIFGGHKSVLAYIGSKNDEKVLKSILSS